VLIALLLAGVLMFAGALGVVLSGAHDSVIGEPQVMVILGCQVQERGPSVLLQDRLDTALDYLEDHPDMLVVVSGGQGDNEPTSEAQAMYDYLVANGVDGEQILLEDTSHSTWQNLNNTFALLKEQGEGQKAGQVLVVSSGFHLSRVRMLFGRVWEGTYTLSTLAAPESHLPSRLKMYIREPLALVKSFLVDR
jgi:uncharacterized SAM-binding protein YcdF (DUF218 family)